MSGSMFVSCKLGVVFFFGLFVYGVRKELLSIVHVTLKLPLFRLSCGGGGVQVPLAKRGRYNVPMDTMTNVSSLTKPNEHVSLSEPARLAKDWKRRNTG